MVDSELRCLAELFDDRDATVVAAVDRNLMERGDGVIYDLIELYRENSDGELGPIIKRVITKYNEIFVLNGLKRFSERIKFGEATLIDGIHWTGRLLRADFSYQELVNVILPVVGDLISEISPSKTAVENVNILNHIFYNRYKFEASGPFDLKDEQLLVHNIVKSKRANPLALSLFYFAVAQSVQLPIYPLCFKGGFVPVYVEEDRVKFYINIFHKGEIFLENNLKNVVDMSMLNSMGVKIEDFEVKRDGTIIAMYLEFLLSNFATRGDKFKERMAESALSAMGESKFLTIDEDDL